MIYFVSTPIGNLKDITLRAIEVLQSADVIFCEDTRHSLKLLNAYDIKKPLLPYTVVPGANAFLSALILSALPADRFAFLGFLPEKQGERRRFLQRYAGLDLTLCFHAAPQDIDRYTADMFAVFGDRRAAAVREITKVHEECVFFSLAAGLPGEKRGEYVLVVEGAKQEECSLNSLTVREHVEHYMAQGMDKRDAVKQAAKDRGVPKNEVYSRTIDL